MDWTAIRILKMDKVKEICEKHLLFGEGTLDEYREFLVKYYGARTEESVKQCINDIIDHSYLSNNSKDPEAKIKRCEYGIDTLISDVYKEAWIDYIEFKKGGNTMNRIVQILMERDKMTQEEAEQLCSETAEEVLANIDSAEEVMMEMLGLEPDYLEDLLYR